jgi:nitrogen-specific signal transduction histidine kinase
MADFSQVPEIMQNQANFAAILLIIWRNALKAIKYRKQAHSAVEMRVLT